MHKLTLSQRAYLAGFLDGDGSIYVRLKPNSTYRYNFQVAPYISFFQARKGREHLVSIQGLLGGGYLRDREDGIVEFVVGDGETISQFLKAVKPHLRLKRKQAELMLRILEMHRSIKTAQDFLRMARVVDEFSQLNYSKKRKITSDKVRKALQAKGY